MNQALYAHMNNKTKMKNKKRKKNTGENLQYIKFDEKFLTWITKA
jgi:hypothetical protein